MSNDQIGKKLHDMATRGKILSSENRKLLQAWYEEQDNAESELLTSDTETETMLQKQIDSVLAGIGNANEEIRKTMNDNNMLREEIIKLQKQLSQKITAQAV